MAIKQCAFFWGNEPAEGGGNFTLQAGVTPSQCVLRFPLRAVIPQFADLTLTDNITRRVFRQCRVSRSVVQQGDGDQRWKEVTIQDRRWQWLERHFAISAEYNRYSQDVTLGDPGLNRLSSFGIADYILEAMGEQAYVITGLPNDVYPTVKFDGDNPAVMLEQLCQMFGCYITLDTNDRVRIYKEGVGQTPRPDERQMDYESAVEPPVIPRVLVYEGGETRIQHDLILAPVGLEPSTNTYEHIDNLSYKPAGGWGAENPNFFFGVAPAYRGLAVRHVWRRYQIYTGPYTGGLNADGKMVLPLPEDAVANKTARGRLTPSERRQAEAWFTITNDTIWRLLPYEQTLMGTFLANGEKRSGPPAIVFGWYFLGGAGRRNSTGNLPGTLNPDDFQAPDPYPNAAVGGVNYPLMRYRQPYDLEPETGCVVFKSPVYWMDLVNNLRQQAVMVLRTSFPIRDPISAAPHCSQYWQSPPSPNAANIPKMVKNSEAWVEYKKNSGAGPRVTGNFSQFINSALQSLNEELESYRLIEGYSAPYKGFIFDLHPDGVVKAVVFDVSESGAGTTHVDYGMERPDQYLTLQELRNRRMVTYNLWLAEELKRRNTRFGRQQQRRGP